jgi:hypothetical protein
LAQFLIMEMIESEDIKPEEEHGVAMAVLRVETR